MKVTEKIDLAAKLVSQLLVLEMATRVAGHPSHIMWWARSTRY